MVRKSSKILNLENKAMSGRVWISSFIEVRWDEKETKYYMASRIDGSEFC